MGTDAHPGPALPPPRHPGRYAVALVCLGNICRSPMAALVLADAVAGAGLADRVAVSSGGTGPWHVGEPMDTRAAATLRAVGLDPSRHHGRQVDASWFAEHDLLLAMDRSNLRDLRRLAPTSSADAATPASDRVRLFRDLDPVDPGEDVPDPYYRDDEGFEEVLAMVRRTSSVLVGALERVVAGAGHR